MRMCNSILKKASNDLLVHIKIYGRHLFLPKLHPCHTLTQKPRVEIKQLFLSVCDTFARQACQLYNISTFVLII